MLPIKKTQPANKTADQPLAIVNQPLSLMRPIQDFLKDDRYLSEINEALAVEINGKLLLKLVVNVADDEGYEQSETFLLKPDYRHPSTSFFKLLEVTGCMPDRGEALDIDSLVGQQLLLTLKTVNKQGNTYVNIVDVEAVPDDEVEADESDEAGDDDSNE